MAKFYFNHPEVKKKDIYIEKIEEEPEQVIENYLHGIKIDLRNNKMVYCYRNKNSWKNDYIVYGVHLIPLISIRLKDFFINENLQYLEFHPVNIKCLYESIKDDIYFFMNILNNVSCLDKEKSVYDLIHPDYDVINYISKVVLDESKIGNRDIFRIAEYSSLIIYSERICDKIMKAGFTGFNFIDISKYRPI